MKVSDVMRRKVICAPQNATLKDVVGYFIENRIDALPVVDAARRVVGLITIDDLVEYFFPRFYELLRDYGALEDKGQLGTAFNANFLAELPTADGLILAADLMNAHLHWVRQDDTLLLAATRLRAQNKRRLPVVDRDGQLVGLISDFEVILAMLNGKPLKTT